MNLLGIETSGLEGSVALVRDQTILLERDLNQVGRRHAQSLILEIGEILRTFKLKPQEIDAVAVSRGPGSFTGLRVGMTCAKTFAYATNCQFVAVDTFAAIAENMAAEVRSLFVVEDAQRDDLFVAHFTRDDAARWMQPSPTKIMSRSDFLQSCSDTDIATGPGLKKFALAEVPPTWRTDPAICRPRAATIALLGQRRLVNSEKLDAATTPTAAADTNFWTATPFYLRLSSAEEKRAANP